LETKHNQNHSQYFLNPYQMQPLIHLPRILTLEILIIISQYNIYLQDKFSDFFFDSISHQKSPMKPSLMKLSYIYISIITLDQILLFSLLNVSKKIGLKHRLHGLINHQLICQPQPHIS